MDPARQLADAVAQHPAVAWVHLVGSRARGDPTPFSDWDFEVSVEDFPFLANDLPFLSQLVLPIAQQWDRLSEHKTFMLVLKGPTKIDLLFDVPNELEPPWDVTRQTLAAVDDHFWDWELWLLSKEAAGRYQLVRHELAKMFEHLLKPMGVSGCPIDVAAAEQVYVRAREAQERRNDVRVSRALETEVRRAFERRAASARPSALVPRDRR